MNINLSGILVYLAFGLAFQYYFYGDQPFTVLVLLHIVFWFCIMVWWCIGWVLLIAALICGWLVALSKYHSMRWHARIRKMKENQEKSFDEWFRGQ